MKKILHIINSLDVGGAEVSLIKTINNDQNKNKHEIIILRPGKKLLNKHKKNEKNLIKKYNFNYFNFVFSFISLMRIIKKNNPDYVNCWMYHSSVIGGLASKFAGISKIIWLVRHNNPKGKFLSFNSRISIYLFKYFSYFVPESIIYNSKHSYDSHKKFKVNFNIKNIIINNGYEIINLKNTKKNQTNQFILSTVTRYDKQKNHKLLFQSLFLFKKKYPNVKWKLLLGGKSVNYKNVDLVKMIQDYNLEKNIEMLDYIKEVSIFFVKTDIYIQTSLDESFPNIVAESMLNYTPVVATNVGDTRYIVDNFGWLTSLNENEIADRIYKAYNYKKNKNKWKMLQQQSRNHIIENFSIDNTIKKITKLWT